MPDQNNPTDTSASPAPVNPTPVSDVAPPPMDIPTGDASFPPPSDSGAGSAAPSFDIPPVVTPVGKPKKFGGKKVIATILGLLVLVGGLGAGTILVRQQQDIREKAATLKACKVCSASGACVNQTPPCSPDLNKCELSSDCPKPTATPKPPTPTSGPKLCGYCSGETCVKCGPNDNSVGDCASNSDCKAPPPPPTSTPQPTTPPGPAPNSCTIIKRDSNAGTFPGYCDRSAPNTPSCTDKNEGSSCTITAQCGGGTGTCVIINGGLGANTECQCQKGAAPPPTKTPTPPPPPPGGGPTAQCLNVKAYDTNWTELKSEDLAKLKSGDKVRFTVGGTTTGGSFDKARFKINGVQRPEVTGKRPTTEEYFDEYTIPEAITTFTINAQIHHTTLGWSN